MISDLRAARFVVERELLVYRRLWRGLFFSSFVTPALFLVAMGIGLGGLVDERSSSVAGLDYLVFVAPGLLVATGAQIASQESLWPVVMGMKWMRFFHGMVASGISPRAICTGTLVWNALRSALAAGAFLLVAAALGAVPSAWGVLAVPAAALCGVAMGAPLMAFAATQDNDVNFPGIIRLVVMPMFVFSGTFFPIAQLPGWLRPLAWCSPIAHGTALARSATTGSLGVIDLGHVAVLLGFLLVGSWFGFRAFARRLVT